MKLEGKRFLTATGLPVEVISVTGDGLLLRSLASENRILVPANYPLKPFDSEQAAFHLRAGLERPRAKLELPVLPPRKPKPLAPLIDAMLLAGNMTMKGIVRELRRKASSSSRGKDLKANVRARIRWLVGKGYKYEVEKERLRLIRP